MPCFVPNLVQMIGRPQRTLDLVSPYFVPGPAGTAALHASGEQRHDIEPGTSWFLRRGVDMLSILPIDWLL